MATKPAANPFQQFISGLFGCISSTPAKPASTSTYAGPYAPGKAPSTTAPPKAAATSTFNPKTDPRIGTDRSWVDPANATAQKAGMPFIPSGPNGGGRTIAPTMTSAATGKPAAAGVGVINPKADPGYVNPLAPKTGSTSGGTTSRTGTSVSSFSAPAAFSAPASSASASSGPTAGSSSGFSYSAPSGFTGGGGTAPNDYRKAYTDMLAGMYSSRDLKEANENLDKLNKQTADAQLFSREQEREVRKNEQGQGFKTFAGDLRENQRKSTAELADLAIASAPFQEYIKNAMTAARETYGVNDDADKTAYGRTRDVASDAMAEKKFQEDVRQFGLKYALDVQSENRIAANAAKEGKATKQDYVGQFASAFTPGNVMGDGTPTTDQNGYINPKAFKAAAAEAAQYGITRKEFIEMFGSQLYADPKTGLPDNGYGLTPVEKKLVAGALPE